MKKAVSILLCCLLLFATMIPAVHAEEALNAVMTAYFDTDHGTVLVLQLDDRVTGVAQDSFVVRIQKMKRGAERFGYDIPSEQIVIRKPGDTEDEWTVCLLDFDPQLCTHIRIEGLLTADGERTLTQQFCKNNNRLTNNRLTAYFGRESGLVDYNWADGTVTPVWLTSENPIDVEPGEGKDYYIMQGHRFALYHNGQLTPSFSEIRFDGDVLTQNDDGSFTAKALGDCTLHAELSEYVTYTWDVHVVREQDWKELCLRAVKSAPLKTMATYCAASALLFSLPFPLLTWMLPVIVPLAVVTAPAAYVLLLAWIRFFYY